MMMIHSLSLFAAVFISEVIGHYTFPNLLINGVASSDWQYIRETNNYQNLGPLEDVTSPDLTCYDTAMSGTVAGVANVTAGSTIGFQAYGNPSSLYHPGVVNVYMAKASGDVTSFTGASGAVWFKVYQISAVTNGGSSITWPAQNLPSVNFTIPKQLPNGQYLVRMEAIALHSASYYGGAQFYIACAQINVSGGGNGTPGPLVAIPGVYTGYEPGILIDIYYPIPANYTQPGPAVWPAS